LRDEYFAAQHPPVIHARSQDRAAATFDICEGYGSILLHQVGSRAASRLLRRAGLTAPRPDQRSYAADLETGAVSQPATTDVQRPSSPPSPWQQPSCSGFDDQWVWSLGEQRPCLTGLWRTTFPNAAG